MIADSRKDMGIQRLAGPEIHGSGGIMLPESEMATRAAFGAVLNSFEGKSVAAADVGASGAQDVGPFEDAASPQDYSKYPDAATPSWGRQCQSQSDAKSDAADTSPDQQTQPALKFDPVQWLAASAT